MMQPAIIHQSDSESSEEEQKLGGAASASASAVGHPSSVQVHRSPCHHS
eukprot:CAMPEP_0116854030 /NCGR_PEP_ID=MMETSP0418-20121206/18329_1 /TAXON_ID=1158023 /ORGANISM="Astrosyne radiata, Strain 13vi08-1A" /LENGTH=48 /DNA_ID= /DNA_START= /DNA_END= /DNA_ORIENTATION=